LIELTRLAAGDGMPELAAALAAGAANGMAAAATRPDRPLAGTAPLQATARTALILPGSKSARPFRNCLKFRAT
jgi:hypothetical protein